MPSFTKSTARPVLARLTIVVVIILYIGYQIHRLQSPPPRPGKQIHHGKHPTKRARRTETTVAPETTERIGSTTPSAEQRCSSNPHFSLTEPVMPPDFLAFQRNKVRKIEKNWRQWGKKYDEADVQDCENTTPECVYFACLNSTRAFRKCCIEHGLLAATGKWVTEQLSSHGIRYFLSTGSALGVFRHHGTIIPWDTDVDMAIYPEDRVRVYKLFSSQTEHFFHEDQLGKGMFWIHASKDGRPRDGPHVEIFYESDYTRRRDLLEPLTPCFWYGANVSCPNKAILNHWFSSGWEHYTGCHYHHDGRSTIYGPKGRVEVTKC